MAKHIYHIPLERMQVFIKENKSIINEIFTNRHIFEYRKMYGKSFYDLRIKEFIEFFKIDKDILRANKTIKYFTSEKFMENFYKLLNFEQFKLTNMTSRDFFYSFVFLANQKDEENLNTFLHKTFLHFFAGANKNMGINIDFIDFCKTIAKHKRIELRESFGENEEGAYFKIFRDKEEYIHLKGKSIKTLRKKVYRELFYDI